MATISAEKDVGGALKELGHIDVETARIVFPGEMAPLRYFSLSVSRPARRASRPKY